MAEPTRDMTCTRNSARVPRVVRGVTAIGMLATVLASAPAASANETAEGQPTPQDMERVASSMLVWEDAPAPAASANKTPEGQPTPQDMERAASSMLVWEDAPAKLKVDAGWEFTTKYDTSLVIELCSRNQQSVQGPKATLLYQVELGETDDVTDPTSLEHDVYVYPDAKSAQKAWRVMQRRALRCTGRNLERNPEERTNVQYLSNGTTQVLVDGRPGIWIQSRFARPVTDGAANEGGYYVFFLNGNAIQGVEYDYPDTIDLRGGLRMQLQKIAQVLAERWSASATG